MLNFVYDECCKLALLLSIILLNGIMLSVATPHLPLGYVYKGDVCSIVGLGLNWLIKWC